MKKLFALMLIMTLTFTMVACGSSNDNGGTEETPIVNPVNLSIEIIIGLDEAKEADFENIGPADFVAEDGSNILEATQLYCVSNDISVSLDNNNSYICEINGLTEKDFVETTGWIFKVNGELPNVGADQIIINENDKITWEFVDFSTYAW